MKSKRIMWTKELAIDAYKKIRKKHGDKTKSSEWMANNKYHSLLHYISKSFDSWNCFKIKCGFNERPLHMSCDLESVVKQYQNIRKEYGNKASNTTWLNNNGHN